MSRHNPYALYVPTRIVGGTITRGDLPAAGSSEPKRPKYGNRKTITSDGVLCDSKKEAARWEVLILRLKSGEIHDLLPHPSFPLYVNGSRIGRITFDSLYRENGRLVCEDVKSSVTRNTRAYQQRLRTFQAAYPHIRTFEDL